MRGKQWPKTWMFFELVAGKQSVGFAGCLFEIQRNPQNWSCMFGELPAWSGVLKASIWWVVAAGSAK